MNKITSIELSISPLAILCLLLISSLSLDNKESTSTNIANLFPFSNTILKFIINVAEVLIILFDFAVVVSEGVDHTLNFIFH